MEAGLLTSFQRQRQWPVFLDGIEECLEWPQEEKIWHGFKPKNINGKTGSGNLWNGNRIIQKRESGLGVKFCFNRADRLF